MGFGSALALVVAVGASPGAFALDDKVKDEYGAELIALASGDLDCSGKATTAALYRDKDGVLIAELTLQYEDEKLEPFSAESGATLVFLDPDDKGCQSLELFDDNGESVLFDTTSPEVAEALAKAGEGGGDPVPDAHVMLKKPLSLPGDFHFGFDLELCDWDNYCWSDGCSNACFAYGVISTYPCGRNEDGSTKWCNRWGCTHWKQHCVETGW